MRKNQRMVLIENRNDPACPVTALTLFRMCCPPDQDRVFCTHATNAQKKEYYTTRSLYKSNPYAPVGYNYLRFWVRYLTCIVGCAGWELMTNHTVRGGLATILNISDVSLSCCFLLIIF